LRPLEATACPKRAKKDDAWAKKGDSGQDKEDDGPLGAGSRPKRLEK